MSGSDSYKRIWKQVALIPEGKVASYGQIVSLAGLPRRVARMVGRALAAAPSEMQLPWHRIVNVQGRIALPPDSNGFKRQVALLEEEGIVVRNGQLNMDEYGWDPSLDELVWGPGVLHDPAASSKTKVTAKSRDTQ
ncbi:MAG: cysteine methyltransferase [Gammaproteobacteria bacterium]|nr:cysteine methyltransferase [Gammaproteobacteria bacterium]MCP4091637.1 cysteine methyltransferase [Gammaproteobacteria bacterium]MCP4276133.1 cysteine methyltransferase [Gammaproteobacteria bacterium]MCP4830877.1 cysteine methyltransferase [Gammaproteobacteria bacterium]MCP4929703.1 cysteine methyltransferase [Gammaproteobacteria bacterium]